MDLFEYIQDFDNPELSAYDRHEQLREAVEGYNNEYGTAHDPEKTIKKYQAWLRSLNQPDE